MKFQQSKKGERDPLDRYETPDDVTRLLVRHVNFTGPVLEPACGTGRVVRVLREAGIPTFGRDIQRGHDFLKRRAVWHGEIATNPPYHRGMGPAFVRHALDIADGQVAMLLDSGFLWSDDRSPFLREGVGKPSKVIVVPWRIYFFRANGEPIEGQANSHAWVVWPARDARPFYRTPEIVLGDNRR